MAVCFLVDLTATDMVLVQIKFFDCLILGGVRLGSVMRDFDARTNFQLLCGSLRESVARRLLRPWFAQQH